MKRFCIVLLACSFALANAKPQYGSSYQTKSQPQKKCKTVFDIEREEKFEKKCETKYVNKCENVNERVCKPKQERVCNTVYENKCQTLTRPKCYDAYKNVPYQDEECNPEFVKECPKVWEVQQGAKVWVPDTNRCVNLKKTKCKTVTKTRSEKYQKCDNERYQKCDQVPKQDCKYETKNECKNERQTKCRDVPEQECKDVHFSVPKQVQKTVCDGDDDQDSSTDSPDYEIFNVKDGQYYTH